MTAGMESWSARKTEHQKTFHLDTRSRSLSVHLSVGRSLFWKSTATRPDRPRVLVAATNYGRASTPQRNFTQPLSLAHSNGESSSSPCLFPIRHTWTESSAFGINHYHSGCSLAPCHCVGCGISLGSSSWETKSQMVDDKATKLSMLRSIARLCHDSTVPEPSRSLLPQSPAVLGELSDITSRSPSL